jgi:segregation and condensation protein A
MRETQGLQPQQIILDDTPQHVHMERIMVVVRAGGRACFKDLFQPPHTRGRLLGIFLAILELIRAGQATAEQPQAFGEIWLYPCVEADHSR